MGKHLSNTSNEVCWSDHLSTNMVYHAESFWLLGESFKWCNGFCIFSRWKNARLLPLFYLKSIWKNAKPFTRYCIDMKHIVTYLIHILKNHIHWYVTYFCVSLQFSLKFQLQKSEFSLQLILFLFSCYLVICYFRMPI